jgi:hypothetical protein
MDAENTADTIFRAYFTVIILLHFFWTVSTAYFCSACRTAHAGGKVRLTGRGEKYVSDCKGRTGGWQGQRKHAKAGSEKEEENRARSCLQAANGIGSEQSLLALWLKSIHS